MVPPLPWTLRAGPLVEAGILGKDKPLENFCAAVAVKPNAVSLVRNDLRLRFPCKKSFTDPFIEKEFLVVFLGFTRTS
jgi:hypothetical protein